MRRILLITIAILLAFACFGCTLVQQEKQPAPTVPTEIDTPEPTVAPTEPTTAAPTTEPPTTAPPATEPPSPKNLQQVKWVGTYIFGEPSYDGQVVQPLPVGTYTIVSERKDAEGNLWGKLKSGLGWIDLTAVRKFNAPVAVAEASKALLNSGRYTEHVDATGEYAIPVAIQACEKLTDISIYRCAFGDVEMVPSEKVTGYAQMNRGDVLVLWVEFPGDFSAFEISFRDSHGNTCRYQFAGNGRNSTIDAYPMD